MDKKPDSHPRVDDEIVNAVKYIRHDLNRVMEASWTANAQRVRTVDDGNQEDHLSGQDLTDEDKGSSRLATTKTASDAQKKRNLTSASRSYYSKDRRRIT